MLPANCAAATEPGGTVVWSCFLSAGGSAHRDGVDFVTVILIERRGVSGGETCVYAADGR
jgi:hypothetical protein